MGKSRRNLDVFSVDEGSVRTGRVLDQDSIIAADDDGVIPGYGWAIDMDIVVASGAHRVVSSVQGVMHRAIIGVV